MIYETFHKLKYFADKNPQEFAALTREEFEAMEEGEQDRDDGNPGSRCDLRRRSALRA